MAFTYLTPPQVDPTPIFEHFRGAHATELLTAAVAHFDLFARLAARPMRFDELSAALGLAPRPMVVLVTALRAMGLLALDDGARLTLTPLSRESLLKESPHAIGDYIGLAAQSPGVLAMVERLRTNRPAGVEKDEKGAAFIFREGIESAMEAEQSARQLTLALAGRAKNVAPVLAERLDLSEASVILDVGAGTGLYAIAFLQRYVKQRAIVFDRPEVLKVAAEMAAAHGVADRVECVAGDMFKDVLPRCDVALLSNVLHDWDVPQNRALVQRCADALEPGGRLLIHDVLLDDDHGGPLPVALYSASLFSLTEGRAYSGAEYRQWLAEAGLKVGETRDTLVHCKVIEAIKP